MKQTADSLVQKLKLVDSDYAMRWLALWKLLMKNRLITVSPKRKGYYVEEMVQAHLLCGPVLEVPAKFPVK